MPEILLQKNKQFSVLQEIFIESGLYLMRQSGPAGLSIHQILAQAGKPRASFYNCFGSKAVYEEGVIRRYFQPETDALIAIAEDSALSKRAMYMTWRSQTIHRLTMAISTGETITSLSAMISLSHPSSSMNTICQSLFKARAEALCRILEITGQASDSLSGMENHASLLLAMLDGAVSWASVTSEPSLVEQYFDHLIKTNIF